VLVLSALASLAACASPATRIDRAAARAGLAREIVQGTDFRHVVYTRAAARDSTWTVFLESDGLTWVNGRVPASDPTTHDPLALQLMMQSSEPALYVSRPCYHELMDAGCNWQLWTLARYSPRVVDSMVAVIDTKLRAVDAKRVRLVGYSGGGALAVLVAERLLNVEAVITIGANLDIDAWTMHHGYLPLEGSLNPAQSSRPHPWLEIHLQGARDYVVPPATTSAYFERYPSARRLTFADYDHTCCWLRDWEQLRARIGE
jgi:pimeloyl-ACP methyl ester carboxylesterase